MSLKRAASEAFCGYKFSHVGSRSPMMPRPTSVPRARSSLATPQQTHGAGLFEGKKTNSRIGVIHGGRSGPIRKILTHAREPLKPSPVSPARGPPIDWGELVQTHDDRDIFLPVACRAARDRYPHASDQPERYDGSPGKREIGEGRLKTARHRHWPRQRRRWGRWCRPDRHEPARSRTTV